MAIEQILAFAVIATMMAAFIWGKIRYDLVAAGALLVAVLVGIVPADAGLFRAFPTTSSSSSAARWW